MRPRLGFDPDMLAPAAFRRIAARLHAQQQSLWSARQAGSSGELSRFFSVAAGC